MHTARISTLLALAVSVAVVASEKAKAAVHADYHLVIGGEDGAPTIGGDGDSGDNEDTRPSIALVVDVSGGKEATV
jgi:hypothetical protein